MHQRTVIPCHSFYVVIHCSFEVFLPISFFPRSMSRAARDNHLTEYPCAKVFASIHQRMQKRTIKMVSVSFEEYTNQKSLLDNTSITSSQRGSRLRSSSRVFWQPWLADLLWLPGHFHFHCLRPYLLGMPSKLHQAADARQKNSGIKMLYYFQFSFRLLVNSPGYSLSIHNSL